MSADPDELEIPSVELPAVVWLNDQPTRASIITEGVEVDRIDPMSHYVVRVKKQVLFIGVGDGNRDITARPGDLVVVDKPTGKVDVVSPNHFRHRYREVQRERS